MNRDDKKGNDRKSVIHLLEILVKNRGFRILAAYVAFISGIASLHGHIIDNDGHGSLVWAMTVAILIHISLLIMNYCENKSELINAELIRTAEAKKKLETQLLKNRQSSSKAEQQVD